MKPEFTDDTPMPFGQHKGKPMRDVPADHLLWLLNQPWIGERKQLHAYLVENRSALEEQAATKASNDGSIEDMDTYDDYLKHYKGM
jgi:hypothetical protein